MSRMTPFSSPLLLGFDAMEKTLERLAKSGDSYPPYNIERLRGADGVAERLRITLAVAGFADNDLEVTTEENQLVVRGRQTDEARARIPASRHRRQAVPALFRAGRRHAGDRRRAQERPARHRSRQAGSRSGWYGK